MTFLCNQANEKDPQIFMKKKNTNFDSIFFFFFDDGIVWVARIRSLMPSLNNTTTIKLLMVTTCYNVILLFNLTKPVKYQGQG